GSGPFSPSRSKARSPRATFILAVDVGTTSMRCHIYDKEASVRGSCSTKVNVLHPQPGWVEMDPEEIWRGFVAVVKGALQDSGLHAKQMAALGISTQRGTFTTWDRRTGVPFHNFIGWQDLRAAQLVQRWNRSCTMKLVHGVMKLLHLLTRQKRFLAASLVVFSTQHVTFRLLWALRHHVRHAVLDDNCCFGTIDTWLVFRLTNGALQNAVEPHVTSILRPALLQMCWSGFLCALVSLPLSIFPSVQDTGHHFGLTAPAIFGAPIPITCMADQQAAMFGECCFDTGDLKITMGTGTFMDINTGSKPHTSVAGLYPLVGWKMGPELVYLAEGNAADTGTAIKWAQELELFSDVRDTEAMASSVDNSDGVCFVPSFSGLQAPLNDPRACAAFMGLKPSTNKCHLVRSILESVAFRNKQLYDIMLRETRIPITKIRADGGVCTNNFIMQMTADLLGKKVERPSHFDMSSLGAAFMAGLAVGFWKSPEELKKLRCTDTVFIPQAELGTYRPLLRGWEQALRRSMCWYDQS
uniref:Glycerol kinase 5 n=1 Tax=Scleropages formosus TaxID=113540 RepID=A0A8C9SJD0_SCLFO